MLKYLEDRGMCVNIFGKLLKRLNLFIANKEKRPGIIHVALNQLV